MVEVNFYPLDLTYKIVEQKPAVYIYGTTADGSKVCIVDKSFQPYFYVIGSGDLKMKLQELKLENADGNFFVTKVEEVKKKLFEKETTALKVFVNIPAAVPVFREEVRKWSEVKHVLEHDIFFVRRYLIDKGLTPLTLVKAVGEVGQERHKCPVIIAESVAQASEQTLAKPKILAVDIETYTPEGKHMIPEEHPILMIALHGGNFKKVLTWKKFSTKNDAVEFLPSEADIIQRFKELVEEFAPDVITGYYSDGFDFPYIRTRANKYNIRLDLGLDFSELRITGRQNSQALITGIVHIDIFKFVKKIIGRSLETDVFTLEAVAQELIGEGKHAVNLEVLYKAWDDSSQELETYAEYNLHDAWLTYRLTEQLFPNIAEFVKVIGLPPFDVNRMPFSQLVENYVIKQAFMANELVPNRPDYREQQQRMFKRVKGAFVFEPKPGLYKNIVVFDYRSLYPSIIASHNISIGTLRCNCCEGVEQVPGIEKSWYCKKTKGFLSSIIEDLITRRARIKEMLKVGKDPLLAARSEALKLLSNSFYGYLGFAQARWYCFDCAESTTAWGRHYIKSVTDKAANEGFKVLYGDTDSAMLLLDSKTEEHAKRFMEMVNMELPGIMELDFEGIYPAGIFVQTKATEAGAKKKYALVDRKGLVKIKGFETVRRNWSFIAKEVQKKVIEMILKEGDAKKAADYVKQVIADLRTNSIPIDKVVIHTMLSKEITYYESVGPHVAAAQRMREQGMDVGPGSIIKFVVVKGKGKIRDKVRLLEETAQEDYDGEYYINNQIIPGVERILETVGFNAEELASGEGQAKLGAFG